MHFAQQFVSFNSVRKRLRKLKGNNASTAILFSNSLLVKASFISVLTAGLALIPLRYMTVTAFIPS
jgi:hypothetical protein